MNNGLNGGGTTAPRFDDIERGRLLDESALSSLALMAIALSEAQARRCVRTPRSRSRTRLCSAYDGTTPEAAAAAMAR